MEAEAKVVVAAVAYKRRYFVAIKVDGCPNDMDEAVYASTSPTAARTKSVDASRTAAVDDQWPG